MLGPLGINGLRWRFPCQANQFCDSGRGVVNQLVSLSIFGAKCVRLHMKTICKRVAKAALNCAMFFCALVVACDNSHAQPDQLDVWYIRANPYGSVLTGVAYGNGQFVAVGNNGALLVSSDGSTWTQYITQPVINYTGIFFGDGAFYAFGAYSSLTTSNCILRSLNGTAWTKIYAFNYGSGNNIKAGAYGDSRLVFVGIDRIITTSIGMTNWAESQLPPSTPLNSVTYGGGRFVAVGYSNPKAYILSSDDGVLWRYDYGPKIDSAATGIVYGNGAFVATWRTNGATDSGCLISTNLSSWEFVPRTGFGAVNIGPIFFGGGQFITQIGTSCTSPDGKSWTYRPIGGYTFAYGQGTFVGVGNNYTVQSGVFGNLTSSTPSSLALNLYAGVSVTGVEGKPYRIEYATNTAPGATWLPLTNFTLPYSPYLWIDPTAPSQPQRFYRALQLE